MFDRATITLRIGAHSRHICSRLNGVHGLTLMCVQSEPDGFATFHLYVCASFLTRFSADLQLERDFQVSCTDSDVTVAEAQ